VDTAPRDLSRFRPEGKKLSNEERTRLIKQTFPTVETLDWKRAFDEDIDLFGRMIRDILKIDQSVPGRPGPRPEPEHVRGMAHLRQLMGEDYTALPFEEAFVILSDQRSLTQLSRKVGLARSRVNRLRLGLVNPTVYDMAQIAEAFGKHPSFFAEYRAFYIVGALMDRLEGSPETSVGLYRKLRAAGAS